MNGACHVCIRPQGAHPTCALPRDTDPHLLTIPQGRAVGALGSRVRSPLSEAPHED
jgi:hypothetical protein